MIDHARHIENVVKDALVTTCAKLGIDKSEVGYAVGGHGGMGLLPVGPGQITPSPLWVVMLSLRSKLLGQPPVADSVGVPGILPPDIAFRGLVEELLKALSDKRDAEFQGNDGNKPVNNNVDLTKLKFG